MGFPIGDLLSIRFFFLLASAQTCQLFVNDLMATPKRTNETNSNFIARIYSALHFNLKHYLIEVLLKISFSTKNCTKMVNKTFNIKLFFTFWLSDLNI